MNSVFCTFLNKPYFKNPIATDCQSYPSQASPKSFHSINHALLVFITLLQSNYGSLSSILWISILNLFWDYLKLLWG